MSSSSYCHNPFFKVKIRKKTYYSSAKGRVQSNKSLECNRKSENVFASRRKMGDT